MEIADLITLNDSAISITTMKQSHRSCEPPSRSQVFKNNQGLFQELKGLLCPRLKNRSSE